MEQHAVPREITSFEFKLIGFMTLHQFYYLLIFGGIAVVFYFLRVIPYVNYVVAVLSIGTGAALAFGKFNDRPIDNLIKNLFVHLLQPTQYYYTKNNAPPDFLEETLYRSSPKVIAHHIDAANKLQKYTSKSSPLSVTNSVVPTISSPQKLSSTQTPATTTTKINGLVADKTTTTPVVIITDTSQTKSSVVESKQTATADNQVISKTENSHPFFTGVVRDDRGTSIGNVLVYIKTSHGSIVRLVKSNPSGVFATFNPLPLGEYTIEAKDVGGNHFFDTMNLTVSGETIAPLTIRSRSAS